MADIFHHFSINAPVDRVFDGFSTPNGLDNWWSKKSIGTPKLGGTYVLNFGPDITWTAVVTKCSANKEFELTIAEASGDWINTRVGFLLSDRNGSTEAEFYHKGWPLKNDHYKISCYCWAMYLRVLKRYLEYGEKVPYERRLEV